MSKLFPAILPTQKGTDVYPSPISPVPRTVIVGDGHEHPTPTQVILDGHKERIGQFVQTQRQLYGLGIASVYRKSSTHPELDMTYMNLHGQETLTLNPKPIVPEPEELIIRPGEIVDDLMYDGYIMAGTIGLGGETDITHATVFLNGSAICVFDGARPGPGIQAVLITFGRDALRFSSMFNDRNNPNYPRKLLKVAPKRKEKKWIVPALFGYVCFGPRYAAFPLGPAFLSSPEGVGNPDVDLLGRISFSKIAKSPLKPKGINTVHMDLVTDPTVGAMGVLYAEFYSRNPRTYRTVAKSWHHGDEGGENQLRVNDLPQAFGAIVGAKMGGNSVDLTVDLSLRAPPSFWSFTSLSTGISYNQFGRVVAG